MRGSQLVVLVWAIALFAFIAAFNPNLGNTIKSFFTPGAAKPTAQVGQLMLFWGIAVFVLMLLANASPMVAYLILGIITVSVVVGHSSSVTTYLGSLTSFLQAGTLSSNASAQSVGANPTRSSSNISLAANGQRQ